MLSKKILMLTAAGIFSASAAVANDALSLGEGLLVDQAGGQVYLMREGGGLEQINIASGKTGWTSAAADRPLLLAGGELTAQVDTAVAGRMDLARLDASTGAELGAFSVALPAEVKPLIDDGLGQSFTLRPASNEKAGLVWRHEKRLVQGAMMTEAPKPVSHVGLLSAESGKWQNRALSEAESLKSLAALSGRTPDRPVDGAEGRQFVSVDGSHVLVSQHQPEQQSAYLWQVFDESGRKLGEVRSRMSFSPFTVLDGMLLYVSQPFSERDGSGEMRSVGLTLRAMDLKSGQQRWQRAVRDTRYSGPYPT